MNVRGILIVGLLILTSCAAADPVEQSGAAQPAQNRSAVTDPRSVGTTSTSTTDVTTQIGICTAFDDLIDDLFAGLESGTGRVEPGLLSDPEHPLSRADDGPFGEA